LSVLIGFVVWHDVKALALMQFWDWLPYLGLLAAFVTGLTRAGGVGSGERWFAIYLFAMLAAWLTVPHWPEFEPAWPVQVALFAITIVTVAALLSPLPARLPDRALPVWLMLTAAVLSVLLTAEVSLSFGKLAALPAGALAGCAVAASVMPGVTRWGGLALPYATLVGGYAYAGAVYPTTPIWLLLTVPMAPLALWLVATGPIARFAGWKSWLFQAVCVIVPLAILAAMLLIRGGGGDEW
jgi:hypothetical protein